MKRTTLLTITSLVSILLLSFHLTQDSLRAKAGSWDAGPGNLVAILILLVYLCGTVFLAGRRSGYIIMLLGSILGCLVSLAHMRGAGLVGGRIANSSGKFFWVWTVLALGVTALFSVIQSARGLWSFPWRRRRSPEKTGA